MKAEVKKIFTESAYAKAIDLWGEEKLVVIKFLTNAADRERIMKRDCVARISLFLNNEITVLDAIGDIIKENKNNERKEDNLRR